MSSYQPKVIPEMVRLGYLGVDPKKVGLAEGYQTRITQPTVPQQTGQSTNQSEKRRPNPYIKK